jgi:hypothetical protein
MEKANSFNLKPASFDSIVDDFHPLDPHDSVMNEIHPLKNQKTSLDDSLVDDMNPSWLKFSLGNNRWLLGIVKSSSWYFRLRAGVGSQVGSHHENHPASVNLCDTRTDPCSLLRFSLQPAF